MPARALKMSGLVEGRIVHSPPSQISINVFSSLPSTPYLVKKLPAAMQELAERQATAERLAPSTKSSSLGSGVSSSDHPLPSQLTARVLLFHDSPIHSHPP